MIQGHVYVALNLKKEVKSVRTNQISALWTKRPSAYQPTSNKYQASSIKHQASRHEHEHEPKKSFFPHFSAKKTLKRNFGPEEAYLCRKKYFQIAE